MRVYLDNRCLNRPFDDQSQARIRLEAEAKLDIQDRIQRGALELAWSYMVDYENQANPFEERREAIQKWCAHAAVDIEESPDILKMARGFAKKGMRSKDALHIACAIAAECDHFLTTDDELLKRGRDVAEIAVVNPTAFVLGETP